MKRFLSILIALILVLSMFSATLVAFADEQGSDGETVTERTVSFDDEAFKKYVFDSFLTDIEMSENFMLDGKYTNEDDEEVVWYLDSDILHEIFSGIRYIELKDEENVVEPDENGDFDADVKLYTLKYDYNLDKLELDDEDAEADEDEDETEFRFQATQHVTLDKAPEINSERYKFKGWKIEFPGSEEIDEFNIDDLYFNAGFVFNMPELQDGQEVTVTAQWIELDPVDAEDSEEDGEDAKEYEDVEVTFYANDKIYVLYCGPSDAPQDELKDWNYCDMTSHFNLTSKGWWGFRFAVVDGVKADGSAFDFEDDVLVTSYQNVLDKIEDGEDDEDEIKKINYTLWGYTVDTTNPVVDLSDTMKDKEEEGLTVGKSYTVDTALKIEDASSTTVTFDVFKKVDNDWVLIYNGHEDGLDLDERIAEDYKDCISATSRASVKITPLASDVTGEAVYKIKYYVVDEGKLFGVKSLDEIDEEYNPEMLLKVNEAEKTPEEQTVEAWKIVLYVVAGLSAVGIVVLLCIKPKQTVVADDSRIDADSKDSDNKKE